MEQERQLTLDVSEGQEAAALARTDGWMDGGGGIAAWRGAGERRHGAEFEMVLKALLDQVVTSGN